MTENHDVVSYFMRNNLIEWKCLYFLLEDRMTEDTFTEKYATSPSINVSLFYERHTYVILIKFNMFYYSKVPSRQILWRVCERSLLLCHFDDRHELIHQNPNTLLHFSHSFNFSYASQCHLHFYMVDHDDIVTTSYRKYLIIRRKHYFLGIN